VGFDNVENNRPHSSDDSAFLQSSKGFVQPIILLASKLISAEVNPPEGASSVINIL